MSSTIHSEPYQSVCSSRPLSPISIPGQTLSTPICLGCTGRPVPSQWTSTEVRGSPSRSISHQPPCPAAQRRLRQQRSGPRHYKARPEKAPAACVHFGLFSCARCLFKRRCAERAPLHTSPRIMMNWIAIAFNCSWTNVCFFFFFFFKRWGVSGWERHILKCRPGLAQRVQKRLGKYD